MPLYKYAFFDFDGTVCDTSEGIFNCAAYAMEKMGVEYDNSYESMRRLIGPPLVCAFEDFFGLDRAGAEEATANYRERYSDVGMFELKIYDGIEEILGKLTDAGVKLAIVSAKPEEYIKRIVKHFGLDKYFAVCVGPDFSDDHSSKTHLISRAMKEYGADNPDEAVMIGDRKFDLLSAAELGIDGVGVSYGFGSVEELESCNPVLIAKTPYEICDYVLGE